MAEDDQTIPDRTLRGFVGYDIKRAFNAIQADIKVRLRRLGLRMVTFSVLVVIRDNPGVRQTGLAEILMLERPNLVPILDELESAGLIRRTRATEDRRAYELRVTDMGQRHCDAAEQAVREHDDHMVAGLGDAERQALHAALRRIEENGSPTND